MTENPYNLANKLLVHHDVDGVRASNHYVTIAHAPEVEHYEGTPDSIEDFIDKMIDGTVWQRVFERGNAEHHNWTGGSRNHSPILKPREQPAGYEIQIGLIK